MRGILELTTALSSYPYSRLTLLCRIRATRISLATLEPFWRIPLQAFLHFRRDFGVPHRIWVPPNCFLKSFTNKALATALFGRVIVALYP